MSIKLCADIIDRQNINRLTEWLSTIPKLTKGEKTLEFEDDFSSFMGCEYSIFCNSGSSANLLITSALIQGGRLKNNRVVVPQVSWSTTVFPVMQLGLKPIMCDCNLDNLGIDIENFEKIANDEKPAAVILVHVLGLDSNIQRVLEICNKHDIVVIEDTCESLGSEVASKKLRTFGLASSFSFYFGHHISTIEGGMVCTNDKDFADIIKMIRSHGWDRDLDTQTQNAYRKKHDADSFDSLYKFYYAGFNLRSTDLQAFIGIDQIAKIDNIAATRHRNYNEYQKLIRSDLWKPSSHQGVISNMGYPIMVSNREIVAAQLSKNDIECRPLVSGSMGMQPVWVKQYGESRMKNALLINNQGMYVPNHSELSYNDIGFVASIINEFGESHVA